MSDVNLMADEKTCPRCDGYGSLSPAWPVGPGGTHLSDYTCSHCNGTGKLPTSRPVMNPPADEAEAGNRANTAPRQADPAAPGRGETGVSSGSEARPVTATERHTPGPWKVIPPGHGHPSEYQCVQYGADERYTSLEMLPADARLIAAAPDLLKASRELFAALGAPSNHMHIEDARFAVLAAIKKAEGRS